METKKIGYFEKHNPETGNIEKSSIRLQMFFSMFFAFIIIGWQAYDHSTDIVLSLILLTAAFAPKLLQNFNEVKKPGKPNN